MTAAGPRLCKPEWTRAGYRITLYGPRRGGWCWRVYGSRSRRHRGGWSATEQEAHEDAMAAAERMDLWDRIAQGAGECWGVD